MLATKKTEREDPARYPGGRKRDRLSPTLVYRIREHAIKLGADARLGTVLGTLGLHSVLSDAEVAAGFKCAEIIGRYEQLKGIPRRSAASPSYQRGFGNGGEIDEHRLSPDQIKAHKRLVRRATKAYDKLLTIFPNDKAKEIIERVCCDDERINPTLHPHLAACLHLLAEAWEMIPKSKAPTVAKANVTKKDDIVLLATACIEALERWAEFEKTKITTFEVVAKSPYSRERGIAVSDGQRSHQVLIPRRGANAVLLDAALRAQAVNKGWTEANAETGEVE